jgi:type I restriction enzyme S subunit
MGQSPDSKFYNQNKNGLPLIQGANDFEKINNYTTQITKTCEKNDIIMSVRAPVGTLTKAKQKSCIGRGVCAIKGNDFIYYLLIKNQRKLKIYSQGTTFEAINSKDLKSLKIHIPKSLEEQQKIANFLSSIDEKIDIVSKKIEKLKEYKKGLLQKLLNVKNGVPEFRFPEFSGKWVEKRLGEICEFFNGKSYESCIVENGQYYLITLNSITLEGKLSQEHKKINVTDNFLQKNDLVIIMSDVAKGDFLGKVSIIPENNKYILNQRVGGIRINKDYHYLFIAYYINNNQKYFKKIGQGSSQKNISTNDIKNFIIHIPPTIEEQQKIAEFLSLIDKKIELNEQKLTKLKEYKKGLLQKMFV